MIPRDTLIELVRDHAPAALAVFDRDMRYLFATDAWRRDYGLGDAELLGRSHYEVFPDLPAHWRDVHRRCLAGATEQSDGDRFERAGGRAEWVRWKIWPWRDAGQIGGIAIFTERITHQKQLEESHTEVGHLLAERERLLEIERAHGQRLDALRRSALSISMLGGRSATCLRELLQLIVDQARVLTSAEYGALGIGNDPARPFEPWVWSGISAGHAEKIGAMPRPIGLLGEVACKGRTLRVAEAHATMLPPHHPELGPYLAVPIQHREHPIGNFYMARRPGMTPFTSDDQSILELLADHAAIAIENETLYQHVTTEMRTREDVLAIVSHDLKSPLNAIALREQQLVRQHGPVVASHASSVTRSIEEMRRLILSLLDMASLDAGTFRLDRRPVDLGGLIGEVTDSLAPLATDRELTIDVIVDVAGEVLLDRDRIVQVLSNLLSNAIKFTPAGGRIELVTKRTAHELALIVRDTGIGIAPAALAHVFDRYFTTANGHRGTGLGLFIVKALVEAHGGTIRVESVVGRGTSFHISIPV